MSTASHSIPFSVAQQKELIGADLSSTLLLQFMFGIYSAVFPAGLYIYVHKESRTALKNRMVIGCMSALYIITALQVSLNWYYTNIVFGNQGSTRVTMFIESASSALPSLAPVILLTLSGSAGFVFADALLVWRCYHACGGSLRSAGLPIALFVVETVLIISNMIYICLVNVKPGFSTRKTDEINTRIRAAMLVSVAVTSVVATYAICRQIYSHTKPGSRTRRRYRNLVDALIQSSGIYSVVVVIGAVLSFTENGELVDCFGPFLAVDYVAAISEVIAGLAPTLMVARLFTASSHECTEVSTALLPSDLVNSASPTPDARVSSQSEDIEMQRYGSTGLPEEENHGITTAPVSA
ncbi:hypothetical protein D9613_012648 [Agrocybe pediades]|uniref:Uncharacterized protein n=1 Tax=Agrocybe pediades TaxID=84607 RepID=A0A8H4VRX4_9AGAR|nr:hypothetical protein D9613_012648 [Agrocybe pediades]